MTEPAERVALYVRLTDRLRALTEAMPIALVTVGCPLRDLYAARFALLYRWMGEAPVSFAAAGPAAAELRVAHGVNAHRCGDERRVHACRAGNRTEFYLGVGAHTHYFTNDAAAQAAEIDRLVGRRTGGAG